MKLAEIDNEIWHKVLLNGHFKQTDTNLCVYLK